MMTETLATLLNKPDIRLKAVTDHLQNLPLERRRWETTEINKKQQMTLWRIAGEDRHAVNLEMLVPANTAPLVPVPFDGKNSLPAFTHFQKVFYRMEDGRIGGFNNQSLMWFTGPGYYVAEMFPGRQDELGVNYLKVPNTKPKGWPEIKPNEVFPTRFIYGNMIDFLRWVTDDVFIGRAYRGGDREMPNWFMLSRGDRML